MKSLVPGWHRSSRSTIQGRYLWAVAFGHLGIDILNSSVAVVLTALVSRFDLNNTQLAWGISLYYVAASLPMPLFGILADRWNGRWLSQAGVFWTTLAFFCAPWAPTYPILLLILSVGGLGSAAFHASGTRTASLSGGQAQTGTATSLFFFLGQVGLSTGPILAGVLLRDFGLRGVMYMAAAVLPLAPLMHLLLHRPLAPVSQAVQGMARSAPARAVLAITPALLLIYIVMRSATLQNYMSLLPKYFADQNLDSAIYGARVGALVLGGSLGTLAGGILDDHMSRRWLMILSLWLSIPFLFLILEQDGLLFYAGAFLAGFITNTSHSVIIIQAQSMLPRREGLASGLALGVMFASGAVMTGMAGYFADIWTLYNVMFFLALLPLLTGALLLWPGRLSRSTPLAKGLEPTA